MPDAQWQHLTIQVKHEINVGAFSICATCSSIVTVSQALAHETFHRNYSNERSNMSNAQWCDPGNHAYKAGEPGSIAFNAQQYGEDNVLTNVQQHACRDHNPFKAEYEARELKALTHQAAKDL